MALKILYEHTASEDKALLFLQKNLLIRSEAPDCEECGRVLTLVKTGSGDKRCFRCPDHKGRKIFLNKDTYFENCQLSCTNIVELMFWWSFEGSVCSTAGMIGLSEAVVMQWFQNFRDVCSHWLEENPYQIGGVGQVVEIRECFVSNSKSKKKSNVIVEEDQQWVFGGVDKATSRGFLVTVPDRRAQTLSDIVQERIAPGSVLHSEGFVGRHDLAALPVDPPYQHLVVSPGHFVDPKTGASTNKIKAYWKHAKRRFEAMGGVQSSSIGSYLDELMWRDINSSTGVEAFNIFIDHLAEWYPAP